MGTASLSSKYQYRWELQSAGAPEEVLDAEVMIGVFTIEGLLMHPLGEERERAVLDTLAKRWFTPPTTT